MAVVTVSSGGGERLLPARCNEGSARVTAMDTSTRLPGVRKATSCMIQGQ